MNEESDIAQVPMHTEALQFSLTTFSILLIKL